MTWQEAGLRLINIGERSARFRDLILPFSQGEEPVESVIWLPNGGGKSSIMALRSAVVLPNALHFTGAGRDNGKERKPRTLEDYVDDGTSHSVISWSADEPGTLLPRRHELLTGAVYEWPSRRRPTDDGARLAKLWWSAVPKPGVLDLNTVPARSEDKLRTLNEFKDHLIALNTEHPELEIQLAPTQTKWEEQLTSLNIDTQLARYQALMNTSEGGIAKVFNFSTTTDFIDFVVDVTCHEQDADDVGDVLRAHAHNLRRRPGLLLEQTFLTEAKTLLDDLASKHTQVIAAEDAHNATRRTAAKLQRRLTRSASDRRARADIADHRAITSDEQAEEAHRKRDQLNRYRLELRSRAAAERHERAAEALKNSQADEVSARRDEAQWAAASHYAEARTCEVEEAEVLALLEPERQGREDLRRKHDATALALRDLLTQQATEYAGSARTSTRQQTAHEHEAAQLDQDRSEAQEELDAAQTRLTQAITRLEVHEENLNAARIDGVLEEGETAGEAADRHNRDQREMSELAERLKNESVAELDRAQDIEREVSAKRESLPLRVEAARRALDVVEDLRGRRDQLAASGRLAELAEADDLDPWGDAPRLRAGLSEAIRDNEARALATAVSEASDRRLLAGIEQAGLLPPSIAAQHVVDLLVSENLQAEAAWQVLVRDFNDQDRARAAESRPDIVSGVVLQTAADRDQARLLLTSTPVLEHVALVTVEDVTAAAQGRAPEAQVVSVPLERGLYDLRAASSTADVLRNLDVTRSREVQRLKSRIDDDKALEAELSAFLTDYPSSDSLASAKARQESEQTALERLEEIISRLTTEKSEAEAHARELSESALKETRRADQSGQQALRARRLADDQTRMTEYEDAQRTATTEIDLLETRVSQLTRDITKAEEDASAEKEAAAEANRLASGLRQEASEIHLAAPDQVPDPVKVADIRVLGPTDMRARYRTLHQQWQNAAGNSALEERLSSIARRLSEASGAAQEVLSAFDDDRDLLETAAREASVQHDPPTCRERAASARQQIEKQLGAVASARAGLSGMKDLLDKARSAAGKARLREGEYVTYGTPEQADLDAASFDIDWAAWNSQETERREAAEQLRQKATTHRDEADQFERWATMLPNEVTDQDSEPLDPFDGPPRAAAEAVATAKANVESGSRTVTDADRGRQVAAARAMRLAGQDRFQELKLKVRDRMGSDDSVVLAKAATDYAREIQARLTTIADLLEQVESAWQRVTDTTASKVRTLLKGLGDASRASTLPPGLGEMSGNQFLTISYAKPSEEELDGRIGQEIMSLLDRSTGKTLPSGKSVLRKCVHAAVGNRGFKVNVLKPNEHMTAERRPVVDVSKFSDGERLTTCVLLFCALARTRLRRNIFSTATGTLMLDNPFGQASAAQLVALQLKVAEAQRVHLVYATGLEDMGALAQFRNILRLRNRKATGSAGFVQHEDKHRHGLVTAVAVARPTAPSAAQHPTQDSLQ